MRQGDGGAEPVEAICAWCSEHLVLLPAARATFEDGHRAQEPLARRADRERLTFHRDGPAEFAPGDAGLRKHIGGLREPVAARENANDAILVAQAVGPHRNGLAIERHGVSEPVRPRLSRTVALVGSPAVHEAAREPGPANLGRERRAGVGGLDQWASVKSLVALLAAKPVSSTRKVQFV